MVYCEQTQCCCEISKFTVQSVENYQYLVCVFCDAVCCLAEVLFDYCQDCIKMPCLPQGAFAACKIRAQQERNAVVAKMPVVEKQPDFRVYPNRKLTDLSPQKYNSKLMNAIWGHYNRYSPHNIKSNETNVTLNSMSAQQLCRAPF